MSGYTARTGFRFQDLYLLVRVLQDASDSLEQAWRDGAQDALQILDKSQTRYGIEASPRISGSSDEAIAQGPDWDVLILAQKKLEFAEVKSGRISKEDRLAFWRRLRHELAAGLHGAVEVSPVLVVDPNKVGDLTKWEGLAAAATQFTGSPLPTEPTNNVLTTAHVLDEALWWLCRPDNSARGDDPGVTLATAQSALARFELHCHEAQQLEPKVFQLIELLFPGGLADTEQNLLLGWLSKRATTPTPDRRLFTIRGLLAEIGILEHAASVAVGTLRDWRDLWNEVPQGVIARMHLQLGEVGESVPAAKVQPAALEALTSGESRSLVILGPGGAGKSTFVAQAAQAAAQRGHDVLHCGADDVTLEELEKLIKAFRFRAAIAATKSPDVRACIFVDGLDEADAVLRKRWGQLLVRLTALPNVSLFASVRDAAWISDGDLRKELEAWPSVTLALWPEKLVQDLLMPTPYCEILPSSVIALLRTPILLDLFWRTFVESDTHDVSLAAQLQTRQNLLAAYWEQRLVHSRRYASVQNLPFRLGELFSKVAGQIGPFLDTQLDAEVLQVLLSEGIFVREGRLQPRLRFRHPLLRDFAFAQWCLATDDVAKVASRWNAVRGGLQRYGALRSLFEALSDPNARNEYPQLELGSVILAIVQTDTNLAGQVAQVLGTHEPSVGLDPAKWPPEVQSSLPANFGRELLSAARLGGNGSWAARIEYWPDDAGWLDSGYSIEVWQYLSVFLERLKLDSANQELREQCRQIARTLRHISEVERFAADFDNYDRFLMMHAILCVIPILPDEATLTWVEREMTHSSWRTREYVLERLIYLVPVNADRAVEIYRKAVGLIHTNGHHRLGSQWQGGVFDHHAIEWSLAGEGERRGLLKEHPVAFLPVALELAEALWRAEHEDQNPRGDRIHDFIREFNPSWTEEAEATHRRQKEELLGGLIDDSPGWRYWRSHPGQDVYNRCLGAIHECAERCSKTSSEFFTSSIVPIMRASRLASIQSILLDLLLQHREQARYLSCIVERLMDSRLYHASGIEYWLEQGLILSWPHAQSEERSRIIEIIRALLSTPEEEHNAKNFLLRLPIEDLPEDLRNERPAEDDSSHQPYERPHQSGVTSFAGVPIDDDDERIIGQWPKDFDVEAVKTFLRATKDLSSQGSPPEKLREKLQSAVQASFILIPKLRQHAHLLGDASNRWVWGNLAVVFDSFHKVKEVPPDELVRGCAELALDFLTDVPVDLPGELPRDDVWVGYRETEWVCALKLADSVLGWPPVVNDQAIQSEFESILERAFRSGNALVQLVCTTTIRPWHWFRSAERRQLHDQLIWNLPNHASVLTWSLERIANYSDTDRTRVFRLLMNRADVEGPKQLAHRLGHYVGMWSMVVYQNGQRSAVAELAREIVETPERFPLLADRINLHEFLRNLIFGMKEQAKQMSTYTELAVDYGHWVLKVWQVIRSHRQRRRESEDIILFGLHWLEKKDRGQIDTARLRVWWQELQPLLNGVVTDGGRPDCFTLFFGLHEGQSNDLTTPEELIRLGEIFTERIRNGIQDGSIKLDEIDREHEEWHSWRESVEFLAETIGSLQRDGSLQTDLQREQAHRLLSQLASVPIQSPKAMEVLHRLQNE